LTNHWDTADYLKDRADADKDHQDYLESLPEEIDRLHARIRFLKAKLNWNSIDTLPKSGSVEVRAIVTMGEDGSPAVERITHWRPYDSETAADAIPGEDGP